MGFKTAAVILLFPPLSICFHVSLLTKTFHSDSRGSPLIMAALSLFVARLSARPAVFFYRQDYIVSPCSSGAVSWQDSSGKLVLREQEGGGDPKIKTHQNI